MFHYFATGSDCEWHWTVELLGGDDMVRWLAWAMLFLALWGCAGAPAEAADVSEVPVEPADVPEVPAEPAVDVGEVAPAGPTVEAHAPEPVEGEQGELPVSARLERFLRRRFLRRRLMRRSQWRTSRESCREMVSWWRCRRRCRQRPHQTKPWPAMAAWRPRRRRSLRRRQTGSRTGSQTSCHR